ncbi:TraB/GumN family protein [Cellulophaga baltica]|uniref:TraB/GumN family protein n=1 Tax=Cellulophaga TaxID=104264 RepID=UPI001C0752B1|nr:MULTISPECIES: TraB/GumN family protein [Cellulophaga]MBU2997615.1 TraB/GumN family protein [Cellulophaga baltica]MDO6769010.1 TraB/GumN family protein [Cellulophaga sp. 1_MG-2023]
MKIKLSIKLTFILVFLSTFFAINAQEKNSLLWEISGNGLEKSSYLYGTMHVSKKIAFRLDDVFFEALDKSEVIALESDPNTWLENNDAITYGFGETFITKAFYDRSFTMDPPRKEEIAAFLGLEDKMINNILYRTDQTSQNFEEDTYLDMFIYQAGKKFNKPIVALEDNEESSTLVGRASFNSVKDKPADWLQKKMQLQEPLQLLEDAYRERNINLLDSLDQGMYTDYYLKNMLYIRNKNMATKLDSVIQKAKVFAGIGAAHLPGKNGVISLLRKKGYTVKALTSKTTRKGNKLKENFEEKIRENKYNLETVDDEFFSIILPNKLYPIAEFSNTFYVSPDLANGSFFTANRIPTFSYLDKEKTLTIDAIDKLLFENIPGKIIEKKFIIKNGYQGIDIKNLLKNGEYQRYQIFVTPLEIIVFKMGGHDDFVSQYADTIFKSIKLKNLNSTLHKVSSNYDDFEVDMPKTYSFTNSKRNGNRLIQAFDSTNNSYRFLKKSTLHDYKFIEEDTFELKRIQKIFYKKLEVKPVYNQFKNNSLLSSAIIDTLTNKKLHLYTKLKGENYYLLGMISSNSNEAIKYFSSFKIKNPKYTEAYTQVKDTALFFSTVTSVKPPKFVANSNSYQKKDIKPYNAYSKKTIYQNKNNEAVHVQLNKSHDFLMFPNIDSIWKLRKKLYSNKKFNIKNVITKSNDDGFDVLELTLTDTASTRGILIKNVIKQGLLYELKAVIDTAEKPSKFITKFFDNFKPLDTVIGENLLLDKTTTFFSALKANDSIALSGYPFIAFNKSHIDSLKYYITEFDFTEDQKKIQSYLIQRLAQLDDSESMQFYTNFYENSYNNSSSQTKILQAITKKETDVSAEQLLSLMSKDLPLVSSNYEIYQIFKPYMDSLPLAKKLYPEILDYSAIEEYKSPIFSLLAKLKTNGLIKPKIYKKYRKQMLNDAKIQLKRELGNTSKNNVSNYQTNLLSIKNKNVLESYIQLLHPFIKEKEIHLFFDKLSLLQDATIQTTNVALLLSSGNTVDKSEINELATELDSRNLLFSKLKKEGKLAYFPNEFKSQQMLAEAQLFEQKSYNKSTDSIKFIAKKNIVFRNENYTGYAFKYLNGSDYDKNFKMFIAIYKDDSKLKSKPFYKNNGRRIEDTETDDETLDLVIEEFILKDRERAEVYTTNQINNFGYYDY